MTRKEALEIVKEHTKSESLIKHMLAVEACMRWYAEFRGESSELWGLAGLLHDFDYEAHPDDHPLWGAAHLETLGADPNVIKAIKSHYPAMTGVEPVTPMERHLFACDELSGFILAVSYVRPSKSLDDLEAKSVIKKLKEPNFAAGVNRDDVQTGADLIGLPLNEHIGNMITAMKAADLSPSLTP